MKLEESNEQPKIFKSNLNEISRGRFESEKKKSTLENFKLLYELQEAVIKCFNYHSWMYLRLNTKQNMEKGCKY